MGKRLVLQCGHPLISSSIATLQSGIILVALLAEPRAFGVTGGSPQGRSESLKFTGIKNTLSRVEWRDLANDHWYKTPMRIYPAVHYTMGGFWVDYNLMSNIPGLHILGEANFSDHGANRLGTSALMQGQKMG